MQTNENDKSPYAVPNIPACVTPDDPGHNFQPMSKRHVYCTKCAANVRFTDPKKDKKNA